ncbi:Hypothetical predicted protein [Paramuricea clavata]|uniref:Uncharacterized protein n=1 Tax=Paramuricea clavata TaxID=317549 RepID=A0A7D9JQK3_PARCT|nr:Hypothetical predicted protein [Paramuricea clavata]
MWSPSRSCLGPPLFVLYVSKPFSIVEKHLPDAHVFADDSQLCIFKPDSTCDQLASLKGFAASSISLTTKERSSFESSTKDSKELELGVHGRIGPRMDHCGTPCVIVRDSDLWDAKRTNWRRSERFEGRFGDSK